MAKPKSFEKILFQNYMCLIAAAALLISVFSAVIDAANTLSNEKQNMYESLKQAQINLNNHTQMIDDYLTLTQADAELQSAVKELLSAPNAALLTKVNEILFSVDLFKKNLDSVQIFAYDNVRFLPSFSASGQYSNALFSADTVSSSEWFQNTLEAGGRTYWFVDTETFKKPTLCAARIFFDVKNVTKRLGIIKANVSVERLIRHLGSISFGEKGYVLIEADGQLLYPDTEVPDSLLRSLQEGTKIPSYSHLLVEFPIVTEGWKVIGSISNWELYQNTLQNLLLMAMIFALSLLLAALLSKMNSRKISLPINQLCTQIQKMELAQSGARQDCIEVNQLYETYNHMLAKNEELIKSREETLLKFKQAEMAALQSQMNPHFIYNTLESISALIATEDSLHAGEMVTGLGNFLRSSLNNGNNYISLEKEIEQVCSYISIQKLRYANQIELKLNLPCPIPEYRIIKLILQPLVENCIIHGFKEMEEAGRITLSVWESDETLFLSVADNGLGSDIEMLNYLVRRRTLYKEDNLNFYCIQNVYQRLCNCYADQTDLVYEENADGGVTATISIAKKAL